MGILLLFLVISALLVILDCGCFSTYFEDTELVFGDSFLSFRGYWIFPSNSFRELHPRDLSLGCCLVDCGDVSSSGSSWLERSVVQIWTKP